MENQKVWYVTGASKGLGYNSWNGNQQGDPEKAADFFIDLTAMENPPLRLFMGTDALERATAKVETLTAELTNLAHLSEATNY